MPSIQIRIDPELAKMLDKIDDFPRLVEAPLHRAGMRIQTYMADYPPARLSSSYIRTGTLGRRWTVSAPSRERGRVTVKVGNNTEYGPFVQSKRFQARMHRGLWQTDEDAVDRLTPAIERDFEREIRRAIAI